MSPTVKKQRSRRYNVVMFSGYRNIVPFRQRRRPVVARIGHVRPVFGGVAFLKFPAGFRHTLQ